MHHDASFIGRGTTCTKMYILYQFVKIRGTTCVCHEYELGWIFCCVMSVSLLKLGEEAIY